ncbi:hypothetical protein EV426DRAFT_709198 [Tirmania nivea]|nr:hypothetical protein EV426DRAFT_709198 [Tirmania nivea]
MSFTGEYSPALDRAVKSAIGNGLTIFVAAEKHEIFLACIRAITVGATNEDDEVSDLSIMSFG